MLAKWIYLELHQSIAGASPHGHRLGDLCWEESLDSVDATAIEPAHFPIPVICPPYLCHLSDLPIPSFSPPTPPPSYPLQVLQALQG